MSPDAQPLSKLTRSATASPGDEVVVLRSGAADPKDRVVLVPADKVAAASGVTVAAILNVLKAGPGVTVTLQGGKIVIASTIQAAAAPGQPDAPTAGVVNDIGDTFSFLPTSAYPSFAQYKVAGLPGVSGAVVLDGTNSYVQNGRIYVKVIGAVATGGLAVYVAGSGNIPDGKPLLSNADFTGAVIPTGDTTAPVISITVPTSGAVLVAGTAVTLTAQATDNVGVAGVTFTNGGTGAPIGAGVKNGNTYTYAYTPTTAGPLTITATAVDAAANSQTASVSVTVQAVANSIPVANAGTDPSITLPTNQVVLQGSGTDADPGDTLTYAWRQVAGAAVSGMPTSVRQPVITFPSAGTYQFGLIATDNHGAASPEDFVVVTVNAAPAPGTSYNIEFEGDSLTATLARNGGTTSTPYPQQLQSAVAGSPQYVGFSNWATGGDSIVGSMSLPAQKAEVVAAKSTTATANFLYLLAGINDLQGGYTAQQVYDLLKALCLYYVGQGYRVTLCTITTSRIDNPPYDHQEFYSRVLAFNDLIRAGWNTECQATVLMDLVTDPALGGYDAPLNTTYFRTDKIHYTDAGAARIGTNFAVRALPYLVSNTPKVINYDSVSDTAQQQIAFTTPVLLHAYEGANTGALWLDQGTANRNATQSVVASRPSLVQNAVFGKAAYLFDGSTNACFMQLPPLATQAQPLTFIATLRSTSTNSFQFVLDCGIGRIALVAGGYPDGTTDDYCIYTASESNLGAAALRGKKLSAQVDTFVGVAMGLDSIEITFDGAVIGQFAPGTVRLQSAVLIGASGGQVAGQPGQFKGYIGAVEVHPGKLTATQVQARRTAITGLTAPSPSAGAFVDTFNATTVDTARWAPTYYTQPNGIDMAISQAGGELLFTPTSNTATRGALTEATATSFVDGSFAGEVDQLLAGNGNGTEVGVCIDFSNLLRWVHDSGRIYAQQFNAGSVQTVGDVAYDSTATRFWRIRHSSSANLLYWETSPDGTTYTVQLSAAPTIALTGMRAMLGGQVFVPVVNSGAAKFGSAKRT